MKIRHKFGAKPCQRNGIKFPSKLERSCYDYMKLLEKQGKILFVMRQVPFDLPGPSTHRVDFACFRNNDVLFIEAKGRDLAAGKLARRQVEDCFPIKIHVVTKVSELVKLLDTEE